MDSSSRSQRPRYGLIIIIVVALVTAACLVTYWLTKDSPETESIIFGNIRHSIQVDVFFVRDEDVLTMPQDGYLISDLKEGEKAAANEVLFSSVEESEYPFVEKISELDRDIFTALTSSDSNKSLFAEKEAVLNQSIMDSVSRMISGVSSGSYSDLSGSVGSIRDALSDKYDTYIQLGDTSVGEIAGLITSRDSYAASLRAHTHSVKVEKPCTVSFNTFSNDRLCEYADVDKLNSEYLDNYAASVNTAAADKVFRAQTKVARAVYGFEYYIVFNVTEEQYNSMYYMRNYQLQLSDGQIIDCDLVTIKDCRDTAGKYCVVLSTRYGLSETVGMYRDSARLIVSDYQGLKIRRSSIFDYNSTSGEGYIYILSKIGAAEKRSVHVIAQDDYFAIIEELPNKYDDRIQVYDEIVVNPASTEEGMISR